ncbi:DNA-binding CsgD family transcriptional regulator [Sphingobium jiangsuense]|uniref:DNA-binding CsgD family transcriptional regulator n=1 Tax=Sphingobium jiangsuense TaxID=870476 RepID=A0A7W6BD84_9SPHN|nr:LuxR family transcriptional regulator [Sphingobium jiangsuense]MBB3924721.1 DNA-binding CsgD family transcriptional regulator [Sphingobium jiangsuense]
MVPASTIEEPAPRAVSHEDLILSLHQGATEQPPWATFLSQISTALQSSYANIVFRQPDGKSVLADLAQGDPDILAARQRYSDTPSSFLSSDRGMAIGRSYRLPELVDADHPLKRSYYRHFLEPAGLRAILIARLAEEGGYQAWFTVARRKSVPDYSTADQSLFDALLPHLGVALRNFAQTDRYRVRAALGSFISSRFELAAVTVSQDGRILGMEPVAQALLENAGGAVAIVGGRLLFSEIHLQQRMADALRTAACGQRSKAIIFHVGDERVEMLVQPFLAASPHAAIRPAAVLYLHRDRPLMGREEEMRSALNEMYDLSPVEADIALGLSRGRTMMQLAGDLGLSENTIRSYSKPIYAKLGVSRQVDLVRLLLTSLARLA